MNKRTFLWTFASGSIGLGLLGPHWHASRDRMALKNWMWISKDPTATDEAWRDVFARARDSGIDAILPEVYDSRRAYYVSERLPVADGWLERIIPLARAEGLSVHAWLWMMPCNIETIVSEHPEWFAVSREGEPSWKKPAYVDYYKFLCPSRPDVRAFLLENVKEVARREGVDGIHLDYIRYPDVIIASFFQRTYSIVQDKEYPPYDYCYCDHCRASFESETGMDPMKLEDPSSNELWKHFRYRQVTTLVNDVLSPAVQALGKQVTAAVFPNWESVRQQWTEWNLDGVMPMLYHGFYDADISWIGKRTAWGTASVGPKVPLYAGLFVPQLTPETLTEAVDEALDHGARGISLFNSKSMSPGHWARLKTKLTH